MKMLAERRLAARRRKLASLEAEFVRWEKDSEANGQLRLHHSQIGRITGVLRKLQAGVMAGQPSGAAGVQLSDREREATALELHRIWEFFRAKFAMRRVEWMRTYLDAVDDFALGCYRPARDRAHAAGRIAATALKEPPLLFFGGGWVPYAMSRDYPFEAERVPNEPIRTRTFVDALKKLPVPVIGIPWFQVEHLPDAVVIGHETGHLVEDDLGLTTTIKRIIGDAAKEERRAAWESWSGEIFGDFWGQLATGPAFVGGLAEALADDPAWIAKEKVAAPRWTEYPPTYLRMLVNFALLRALKFSSEADALDKEWKALYGETHAMAAFEKDLDPIAQALVTAPFPELGNKAVPQVFSFGPLLADEANIAVKQLAKNATPAAGDVRALIAAARLRFAAAPDTYDDATQNRVLEAIALSLPKGVRGSRSVTQEQDDADTKLGDELITLLASEHRDQPEID